MKWVVDTTGRFGWRPFYEQEELDYECEQIVSDFLINKYGAIQFPITTDELSIMIERDTSDLDLFADLSLDGYDVEGTTDFFPHKKPVVKIAKELSLENSKYFRLRTTLAHEYGHVKFHNFLWGSSPPQRPPKRPPNNMVKKLSSQRQAMSRLRKKINPEQNQEQSEDYARQKMLSLVNSHTFRCTRGLILQAPISDWMEWQASYICGATLMPLTVVRNLVQTNISDRNRSTRILADSAQGRELITQVAHEFDVSTDAAQVRLLKIDVLQQKDDNVNYLPIV